MIAAAGSDQAVLSVAVTGHRGWDGLAPEAVHDRVDRVLNRVEQALAAGLAGNPFDAARRPSLRLITALAAGADQIAARAARARPGPHAWDVQAILPFDRESYGATMKGPREVSARDFLFGPEALAIPTLELADWDWRPGDAPSDEHGGHDREWERRRYVTVGQILVQQADLIIAVWDGEPARGPGGTAQVVAEAWRFGVPVVWIDSATGSIASLVPAPLRRHVSVLDVAERLRKAHAPDTIEADGAGEAIGRAVDAILLGSDAARARAITAFRRRPAAIRFRIRGEGKMGEGETREGTDAFVYAAWLRALLPPRLKPRPFVRGVACRDRGQTLTGWLKWLRWWPFVILFATDWHAEVGGKAAKDGGEAGETTAVDAVLQPEADRADLVANHCGNVYRSGYFLIFMLAGAAVFFALGFLIWAPLKPWLVPLEIAALGAAFYVLKRHSARGFRGLRITGVDFHHTFLEARMIRESLRGLRMLSWVGLAGRRALDAGVAKPQASHIPKPSGHAPARPVWVPHYVNALMATTGLPTGRMTAERVAATARAASRLLAGQSSYHAVNAERLDVFHRRLDELSIGFVAGGFACALLYMGLFGLKLGFGWSEGDVGVGYRLYHGFSGFAAFAGGVLPALAAALTGMRYHGDFARFAERSKETARQLAEPIAELEQLASELSDIGDPAHLGSPPFERLCALINQAHLVLEDDVSDWRFAYAARPMPAP